MLTLRFDFLPFYKGKGSPESTPELPVRLAAGFNGQSAEMVFTGEENPEGFEQKFGGIEGIAEAISASHMSEAKQRLLDFLGDWLSQQVTSASTEAVLLPLIGVISPASLLDRCRSIDSEACMMLNDCMAGAGCPPNGNHSSPEEVCALLCSQRIGIL